MEKDWFVKKIKNIVSLIVSSPSFFGKVRIFGEDLISAQGLSFTRPKQHKVRALSEGVWAAGADVPDASFQHPYRQYARMSR